MDQWTGKVAVVTGASSGIGAAVVKDLVKKGLNVVALARRIDRLTAMQKELEKEKGKLKGIQCDLTQEDDIINAFKWIENNWGAVNILINNAGYLAMTKLQEVDTKAMKQMFDTNVIGLSLCAREAVKSMKAHKVTLGYIVNVNSVAGHAIYPLVGLSTYSATKHSVTVLSETLRLELAIAKLPIKVTSLSPGLVMTEMSARFTSMMPDNSYPVLKSEDISDSIIYLLSTPPNVNITELTIQPTGESNVPDAEKLELFTTEQLK